MHDDDRTAAEWAARVDLDTLAAALSIPNQDSPTARAARAEWDRRTSDELADDPTPTVSERIRRRRAARAQITGYDNG